MTITVGGSNITFPDSTTQSTAFTGGFTAGLGSQVFTSSGTFTIPTGVTALKVTVDGGGGGGGGCTNYAQPPGSGSSGGYAISYLTGLTSGGTLAVTIGAGGAGATGNGSSGGTSSVASGTQTISTVSATGGGGGTVGNCCNSGNNGAPGQGSGGTMNFKGGYAPGGTIFAQPA